SRPLIVGGDLELFLDRGLRYSCAEIIKRSLVLTANRFHEFGHGQDGRDARHALARAPDVLPAVRPVLAALDADVLGDIDLAPRWQVVRIEPGRDDGGGAHVCLKRCRGARREYV